MSRFSQRPPQPSELSWRTKLIVATVLTVLFMSGYLLTGRFPLRSAVQLNSTFIDDAVPFSPGWVWVYQSVYLLMPMALLMRTKSQLRSYISGFFILAGVGFLCFIIWPVAGPRPDFAPGDFRYRLLMTYDTPLNCFPSLHVGLAAFTAVFACSITSGRIRQLFTLILPVWVVVIAYSTLATKQHYFIDLPAGVFLALLAKVLGSRLAYRNKVSNEAVIAFENSSLSGQS